MKGQDISYNTILFCDTDFLISSILHACTHEFIFLHVAGFFSLGYQMLLGALPNRHGGIIKLTFGADGPEAEKLLMESLRTWLANFSACLHEVSDMYISKGLES